MTARHGHLPRVLLVTADVAAAAAACVGAYALRIALEIVPVTGRTDVLPARYLEAMPIALSVIVAAIWFAGLHGRRHFGRVPSLADALRTSALALVFLSTAALLYWRSFQYSRLTIALAAILLVPALLLSRALAARALRALARDVRRRSPALVVGGGAPARALARALAAEAWMPVEVVALLPAGEPVDEWPRAERLQTPRDAVRLAEEGRVREVYLALPGSQSAAAPDLLALFAQTPADLRVVPDLGDTILVNPGAAVVGGVPVVSVRERPLYGLRAAGKRLTDVALAAALLVVLAPLLLVLALLVALTSRGPVLYRQERMGLDGRPFAMLKFRTMGADAEAASGPVLAKRGDPRVTPLGKVLRRLSLDELPQLWNVLRGEMSLVGPRPERAPFVERYRSRLPGYMHRHTVKSGMTGWAQVNGLRGDSSLEERLRYDLEYIDRWSLLFDLEILGRTAVQVVVGRNAY